VPDQTQTLMDTFFQKQEQGTTLPNDGAAVEKVVNLGGMSDKEFEACIRDKMLEDQVAQSRLTASQQLGVDATPTFFVNGKKFDGAPTVEAFDQALSGAAPKS